MRTKEEEEEYYFHKVDFIESQKSCFTQTKPLKKAAVITTTSLPLDGPSFMQRASSWSAISAPLNLYPSGEQEKGNLKKFFVKRLLMTVLDTAVNRNALRYSRQSWILYSTLGIPDSTYWIVESGFRIPIVSVILCSLNLILDFQSPGFQSPQATISLIPETGLPHLG